MAVDDGAMFVGGSDNASGTINDSKTGATKVSNRKKRQKQTLTAIQGIIRPALIKSLRRSLKRSLRKSSSAKEISDANMTMTLISCMEEALMMKRCPLKRLTVLSVRLQ